MKDALDLINRQQAEIEELESEVDRQYEQAEADILGNLPQGGASCHWCIDKHKSYARKELAERLKQEIRDTRFAYEAEEQCECIDNILKEMVGDINDH
jgi:hypothetical protein